jgi:hypothetical protein
MGDWIESKWKEKNTFCSNNFVFVVLFLENILNLSERKRSIYDIIFLSIFTLFKFKFSILV